MEILQTLVTTLTMPNEELINFVSIFYRIIEAIVTMLFFITLLNIKSTKKQKSIFIILSIATSMIYNYVLPNPINTFMQMFTLPILIILCLKTTILKGIIAQILTLVVITIFEPIIIKSYCICFNISNLDIATIPIYRLTLPLFIYTIFYVLYKLSKKLNFNIKLLDNMSKTNKLVLTINTILGIFAVIVQLFIFKYYSESMPFFIIIIAFISLLIYFFTSIYSLTRTTKLEITNKNLEESQKYNKSL